MYSFRSVCLSFVVPFVVFEIRSAAVPVRKNRETNEFNTINNVTLDSHISPNPTETTTLNAQEIHSRFPEIVQTVTNTTILNDINQSTSGNSTNLGGDAVQSSFNFALIPLVAAVVFIIAGCLKCCQWFRRYTRGGSKDENYYAEIVEDGDEGHVDMSYNDTVSSYSSFLRRTNDFTNSSLKSFRPEFSDSPRKWLFSKIINARSLSGINETDNPDVRDSVPLRSTQRSRAVAASMSSVETEVDLNSSDGLVEKRNRNFKVSFVTDDADTKVRTYTPSNCVRDSKTKDIRVLAQQAISLTAIPAKLVNAKMPEMVTVGTQTNKTFRPSLSSVRHGSDSKVDRPRRPDKLIDSAEVKGKPNSAQNLHHVYMKRDPVSVPYPIEANVKFSSDYSPCNSDLTATEYVDDVFESDREPDVTSVTPDTSCTCNKNENVSVSSSQDNGRGDDNTCQFVTSVCNKHVGNSGWQAPPPVHTIAPCLSSKIETVHIHSPASKCDHVFHQAIENSDTARVKSEQAPNIPLSVRTGANEGTSTVISPIGNTMQNHNQDINVLDSPVRSDVCHHCGMSLRRSHPPHRRYNSELSDNISSSMNSLESSGYAEELSFDGSE